MSIVPIQGRFDGPNTFVCAGSNQRIGNCERGFIALLKHIFGKNVYLNVEINRQRCRIYVPVDIARGIIGDPANQHTGRAFARTLRTGIERAENDAFVRFQAELARNPNAPLNPIYATVQRFTHAQAIARHEDRARRLVEQYNQLARDHQNGAGNLNHPIGPIPAGFDDGAGGPLHQAHAAAVAQFQVHADAVRVQLDRETRVQQLVDRYIQLTQAHERGTGDLSTPIDPIPVGFDDGAGGLIHQAHAAAVAQFQAHARARATQLDQQWQTLEQERRKLSRTIEEGRDRIKQLRTTNPASPEIQAFEDLLAQQQHLTDEASFIFSQRNLALLLSRGTKITRIYGDGNCLFSSFARGLMSNKTPESQQGILRIFSDLIDHGQLVQLFQDIRLADDRDALAKLEEARQAWTQIRGRLTRENGFEREAAAIESSDAVRKEWATLLRTITAAQSLRRAIFENEEAGAAIGQLQAIYADHNIALPDQLPTQDNPTYLQHLKKNYFRAMTNTSLALYGAQTDCVSLADVFPTIHFQPIDTTSGDHPLEAPALALPSGDFAIVLGCYRNLGETRNRVHYDVIVSSEPLR